MKDPETDIEWQNAVDGAEAMLLLDAARQYGLVTGGPRINQGRCEAILAKGRSRGILPRPNVAEQLVVEFSKR